MYDGKPRELVNTGYIHLCVCVPAGRRRQWTLT